MFSELQVSTAMPTFTENLLFASILGLSGGELILVLVVILVFFAAKRIPEIARGLGDGLSRFRNEFDREANDAGKSLGGIYGKPAAQALTPDDQTAELYNPAAFRDAKRKFHAWKRWCRFWKLIWRSLLKYIRGKS